MRRKERGWMSASRVRSALFMGLGIWGGGNTFVLGNVEDAGCPREVTFENGI